jgi:putative DNA primase/helicase
MNATHNIPAELRALPQWVGWRYEERNGQRTKPPIDAKSNGKLRYARTNDPTTWSDFETAVAAAVRLGLEGQGLCLSEDDGLCGLDLDHVLNPDTDELTPEAVEVLARFAGTYIEVSPSGEGLRVWCKGQPQRSGKCVGTVKWLEIYAHPSNRYLTVTGNRYGAATAVTEQQAALDWLHEQYMVKQQDASTEKESTRPDSMDTALDLDDAALLTKARNASNGAAFETLWRGDTSAHNGDHSAADLALCNALAFWTDRDAARMDRLFRQSGLLRPKWDVKHHSDGRTYGQATIATACDGCREPYSAKKPTGKGNGKAGAANRQRDANLDAGAVDDAKLARLFQTDLGNSERLVARHGRELRYCYDFGKWLVWDGVRWAIDRDGAALDKAKETARKMLAEAATLADKEDSRKLAAWSFRSQARDRMAAMLYLAQPDVSVRPEHLDTPPWLLNVVNGTIDLRTGTLRPADRAHLLTKASPVTYDPHATCPQWIAFIDRIFQGHVDLIRFVQKAAGYSLTGLDTEECFFVLYGVGQNGKSTFVETLSALLGTDYAQQATPDLLMQKKQDRHATELAVLRGARLVASVETGQGKRLNEVLIKSMTGGDRIRANFMHQDTFEFRPEFKVWLSTNHKPVITGTDLGIWRRIRLVPFTYCIPESEKDGSFKTRLREPAALSGILNWALEGVLLWQQEGLKPPQAVLDATQAYREEMDVLASWIADCCVVTKWAEASAADLYRSYVQWREQNGERSETQTSFGLRLTERGFERVKRRNGIFWMGIGLLSGEQCEQCEPFSDIKDTNSRKSYKNVENGFTPFTPFTQTPSADISSQHPPLSVETKSPQTPRPAAPLTCRWDAYGDRLVMKCANPEPNADHTGCANCGECKP